MRMKSRPLKNKRWLSLPIPALLAVAGLAVIGNTPVFAANCQSHANIAVAKTTVYEGDTVTLDGSGSKDTPSQAGPTSYSWNQTSGSAVTLLPSSSANIVTFTAPQVTASGASLVFKLTVTGCSGSDSDEQATTITVLDKPVTPPQPVNQAPTAVFTVSPNAFIYPGTTVTLDGSASSDPTGDGDGDKALSYTWQQIDIVAGTPVVSLSNPNGVSTSFVAPDAPYPNGLSLHFKLTVSDGTLTGSTDKYISISWQNQAPKAKVSCPASVNEGAVFTLNGSNSTDADDGIASYVWNQESGGPIAIAPADLTTADTSWQAPFLASDLADMQFKLTVTDNGGLSHSTSCTVKVNDVTVPVAAPEQDPQANGLGWNNTDVTVDWHWKDAGVGIDDANCTPASTSSGQGPITLNASCKDKSGNEGSATYQLLIDKTLPTIDAAATTLPNANLWYNNNVSVHFSCFDAHSGIAFCPVDQVLSNEGLAVSSLAERAADKAGNQSAPSNTVTVSIDKTAPTIDAAATTPANSYGWYNGDVSVQFTCFDALSGIVDCPSEQALSGEGEAITSLAHTVFDKAGNESAASKTVAVNIDKTKPTISAAASSAPNSNGWYNSDVTVQFTCFDALSGIVDCPANQVLNSEGLAVSSLAKSVFDKAGNESDLSNTVSANIDKTAPVVNWNGGITDGAVYYYGFVPAAPSCSSIDSLSGPDACVVTGYSDAIGEHTLIASATDKAGNVSTVSRKYTVNAWTLKGFYQPVDMGNVLNTVKNGSTVPLKFEIFAGQTELTDVKWVSGFSVYPVTCGGSVEDAVEMTTTGATSLRYDATAGQFVQNWQTPKSLGSCYVVRMTTKDGSKIEANFKLK